MKTIIYTIILATILLISCSENFLEVESLGRIPQEEYYKTDEQALAGIVAVYDILQSMYAQDWNSAWMVKVLPSDESTCGGGKKGDQPPYEELDEFRYTSENRPIEEVFKSCYYGIYRANIILQMVEGNTDAKKIIIGEAKCLRAYYYFELVTMFGKVPLVLEPLKNNEYAQPPAEESEIWTQIEKDLKEAIQALPVKSQLIATYGQKHAFRVTKGTAQALLGKAYLYQKKYDLAAQQFENVISSGEYDLEEDFSRILRKDTEFGKESLFEISYSTEEGHTWANGTFPWGNGRKQENNIHWQLCGPRGDGYFEGGNTGLLAGWGFVYPTTKIFNIFKIEDSIRRKATIMTEEELIAQGGKIRKDGELPYGCEGYIRLKYGTWADETDVNTQAELNYGTNIRLIRYADVLLMAAEAYHFAQNYGDSRALTELNKVRTRAKVSPINVTGNELFNAIVYERAVELAFEGHRFADIIRWGLAEQELSTYGYSNAKYSKYPIPKGEIISNPYYQK